MATYKEMKTLKFPDSDIIYVITDDGKIEKDQGVDNAGKVFSVGEDGLMTLIDAKNLETEIPAEILLYTQQTLTDEQKSQVRTNIGAGTGSSNFSGDYNDLTNLPELFSGSYNDLTDTPTLFSGSYNDLTDKPVVSSVDVDTELSADSTNPVQNKIVTTALNLKMEASVYDPDDSIKAAGGIAAWITANYDNAEEMSY